jgi:pimeloyl-ACP methyl ester carboxylesterase
MQPLFEHRMEFAGFDTRVLELEALPHTQLELLEGVGHCPQLEATGRLLELLLPFPAAVPA